MPAQPPLLQGFYWVELDAIRARHAAGAELDALDAHGSTPLTEAIRGGTGYPAVVRLLLELGADPSREDGNGYTPWLACLDRQDDPVVAGEYRRIRELLEQHGASRDGEAHRQLQDAAAAGDLPQVTALLEQGLPAQTRITCPLAAAIFAGHLPVAERLLQHGAHVEGIGTAGDLTLLMHAANSGLDDAARLLVAKGADFTRAMDGPEGIMTPAWYARSNGHLALADWLASLGRGAERCAIPRAAINGGPRAKFIELYRQYTSAPQQGLDTRRLVDCLVRWDKAHGVQVSEVGADRLRLHFESLPEDLDKLVRDLDKLCPSLLQGFADVREALEHFHETDTAPPIELSQLCEGLDPQAKTFAHQLLQRSLRREKTVSLYWD